MARGPLRNHRTKSFYHYAKACQGRSLKAHARGERAKREDETGAPDTADVKVIDVSDYHPPAHPLEKVARTH